MIAYKRDITTEFNKNNGYKWDASEWMNVTFQFVGPSGTINIQGTNDSNPITGVSDGSAFSSINYTAIQAKKLSDGTYVTTVTAADLYSILVLCKFLFIGGAGASATKVILFANKPY